MSKSSRDTTIYLAAQLGPSILRLGRHLRREANKSGRSSVDVQILKALEQRSGTTVAELAAAEQMSRPCMSEHIKRLVLQGYVKRAQPNRELVGSPVALRITRTGKSYLAGVARRRSDWLTLRLDQLRAGERSALDRATKSLQSILDAADAAA
jgi:DNA-binding MarR family transcriptional regulator